MRTGSSHRNHCNVVLTSRSQSVASIFELVLFFHNPIHRNLVFTLIFALTSFQRLFSLFPSTAERIGEIKLASPK
jgi:hypothetical protein